MASDMNADRRRDFIGYGRQRPKVIWPNKAQLAVSFVVNLEEGAEASLEDGQLTNDKLGEFVSSLPDGMRDLAMEQFHEYGLRAGRKSYRAGMNPPRMAIVGIAIPTSKITPRRRSTF